MAVDIVAVLRASIDDFKAKMADADVSVKTLADSSTSNFSKISSIGKGAFLGVGAAVAGIGIAAVDFGDKLESSQAGLQAALRASGESWSKVSGSVAQTGAAATKYGFTQAQVDAALTQGVISTQSYAAAHRNLAVAVELAAAKHIDLSSAMQAVDKAAIGQTRALKQMGIDIPVVQSSALKLKQAQEGVAAANLTVTATQEQVANGQIKASAASQALATAHDKVWMAETKLKDLENAHNVILDTLSKRLSGQASAAANTFAGRIAAVRAQGENLAANLGLELIPILERVVTTVMDVVQWFEKHKDAAIALAAIIGTVLVAAIGVWIAGMIAATVTAITTFATFVAGAVAATIAMAPLILPILAIIAVVALLGVAIYELVTHWTTVWHGIKEVMDDAVTFIRSHSEILMAIPFVGWMLYLASNWRSVWADIQTVVNTAWGVISGVFNTIKSAGLDVLAAAVGVLRDIWDAAWNVVAGAVSTAWSVIGGIIAAINFAISGVASVIGGLEGVWNSMWQGIAGAIEAAWSVISPVVNAITGAVRDVSSAVSSVTSAIGGIVGAASSAAGAVGGLLGAAASIIPHAAGGPVSPGQPYLVGEQGPELFIPGSSGSITPNNALGGGSMAVTVLANISIDGQQFLTAIQPAATIYQRTVPLSVFGTANVS